MLPDGPNVRWSLDFVHNQVGDGRRFRFLAIFDDCSRERLARSRVSASHASSTGWSRRGEPRMIVSDNGTELTANAILRWADDTC